MLAKQGDTHVATRLVCEVYAFDPRTVLAQGETLVKTDAVREMLKVGQLVRYVLP